MLPDLMYLVISDHRSGPLVYEVDVADMTRVAVAEGISQGQFSKVLHVIELNPKKGTCREVTDDFRKDPAGDPDDE